MNVKIIFGTQGDDELRGSITTVDTKRRIAEKHDTADIEELHKISQATLKDIAKTEEVIDRLDFIIDLLDESKTRP